jgi:hypothetical protein
MDEPLLQSFDIGGVSYFVVSAKCDDGTSYHIIRQGCEDLHIVTGEFERDTLRQLCESFQRAR